MTSSVMLLSNATDAQCRGSEVDLLPAKIVNFGDLSLTSGWESQSDQTAVSIDADASRLAHRFEPFARQVTLFRRQPPLWLPAGQMPLNRELAAASARFLRAAVARSSADLGRLY